MIKRFRYHLVFFILITVQGFQDSYAQVLGNEWIVSGQTYYKIPVARTGTYLITGAELANAGLPISSVNPQKLQLWHRGIEQAITVKGEANGVLESADSLFFYGEVNDGTLDSLLYLTPSLQPHKYYNLYSDTTAYFLTWSAGNGKRMKLVNNSSTQPPVAYHLEESLTLFNSEYETGRNYNSESHLSEFDEGEGWFGHYFNGTSSYTLNAKNHYPTGPWSQLDIQLIGRNEATGTHNVTISIGDPAHPDTVFILSPFGSHSVYNFTGRINPSFFSSGDLKVNVIANTPLDLVSLSFIKLTYPQTTDMYNASGKYFILPPNALDTSYMEIANPAFPSMVLDITDKDSVRMINPVIGSGLLKLVVPGTLSGRKLYINSVYLSVPDVVPVNLTNYATSSDFIIITHTKLLTSSRAYAAYRASTAGGAYDTLVADVNRLYDLFSYGERTPLAIRRFAKYLLNNGAPEYFFLIGKGMGISFGTNTSSGDVFYRKDPNYFRTTPGAYHLTIEDLVPPAGYPCSDILFTKGLDNIAGNENIPAIITGRLSARDNATVNNYLAKVMEHEALPYNQLWRKNLIHISGGDDEAQIKEFKDYVNHYKGIAEGPLFGGKVIKTFSKESSSSVDDSFRQSVAAEVNKGASYITFFGHSSPAYTDVDLGFVSNDFLGYNNQPAYPLLFVNGCYSANLFNYYSYAEDWVITPKRGAIAAIGHTDIGYTTQLFSYDMAFYHTAFSDSAYITKSIGAIQKKVLMSFAAGGNSLDPQSKATTNQMILHGDPAIKLYNPSRNDYSIYEANSDQQLFLKSYNGNPITAVSDSFSIGIIVSNFGQAALKDSFSVTISRTVNNQNMVVYGPVWYDAIYYKDTIYFKIKSKDLSTFGENTFTVKVDALDLIQEMKEDNNTATLSYFIPLSAVTALFPVEYSIVNSSFLGAGNTINLIAQSTDLVIGPTDYYFEIDTSYLFNSLSKKSATVQGGSLATWNTTLLSSLPDSIVYYWRARLTQVPAGQDTLWGESSFIYIGGSPEGWSQSEFAQFTKDNLSYISLNVPGNRWEFPVTSFPIHARSVGSNYPPNPAVQNWRPAYETEVSFNKVGLFSQDRFSENCDPGLIAMAINKNTGIPYLPAGTQGTFTCGAVNVLKNFRQLNTYAPPGNGDDQYSLMTYIDAVRPGDYIMLCSNGEVYGSSWTTQLKDKLNTALGARLADSITTGRPYIILAVKGNYPIGGGPAPIAEKFTNTSGGISMDTTIVAKANTGTITSTLIGPSTQWGSLFRTITLPDASDHYDLKIIKIKSDGTQDEEPISPFGISYDLSTVAASVYPYIRLVATVSDTVNLTPPQLLKWQVVYAGVPEGTMNPEATNNIAQYQTFTKTEGQYTDLTFVFSNIFHLNFPDSIKIKFTITNESGHLLTDYITLPPLKRDSSLTFKYTINSIGFVGKNIFQAFVNPRVQPEQYYDNNIIEIPFIIEKDKTGPVLDVAFDGQHIMNGDVVSPSPLITISLNDENKYLIKTDLTGMDIFLQWPGSNSVPTKINASDLTYGQVPGNSNTFRIEYHPKDLPDGVYTLFVQGADVTGNKSGARMYEVKFEVVNEVAISYFYPYPNPFSTSTRFVFTLTGNEVPEDIKIQIMTVTGKVVREIMKSEIGPIRIGNNKTEYAWDGSDEFGDKLANGVYLYRVIIKGADDFKHKQTGGDKNFKKDWGKLYILR
jgi:hypothetical protein